MQFEEIKVAENKTDSVDRLKFIQFDRLQQNIAKEFVVPTELVNALNKDKKLNPNTNYQYDYDTYFDRVNKYLDKIVQGIKDPNKAKSARESANALKDTFNRLTEYFKLYKIDSPAFNGRTPLQHICDVNIVSYYNDIELDRGKNDSVMKIGLYNYINSLNSSILNENNEDIYDVLMSIYNDAGIGYDKLDDPEAKFLCHISQSLKNSVQKCETLSTQLELLEINQNLIKSENELKQLKSDSENLAIECDKTEISIDKIDEKVDEAIKKIEDKRKNYKEKSDAVIENKIKEKKQALEADYNKTLNEIKEKSHVERDEKILNDLKFKIEEYKKTAESVKIKYDKARDDYDAIKAELDVYSKENKELPEIKDEFVYNNIVRLGKEELEKIRAQFGEDGKHFEEYLNESPEELTKKIANEINSLRLVTVLSEDIKRNAEVRNNAEFIRNFKLDSSPKDRERFVELFKEYFSDSSKEKTKEINDNLKMLYQVPRNKNEELVLAKLKNEFRVKNEINSRNFGEDYRKLKKELETIGEKRTNPEEIQKELIENQNKLSIVSKIPKEFREKINEINSAKNSLEIIKKEKDFKKASETLNNLNSDLKYANIDGMKAEQEYERISNSVKNNKKVAEELSIKAKNSFDKKINNIHNDKDIKAYYDVQKEKIDKFDKEIEKAVNYKTNIKNSLDKLTQDTIEKTNNHNLSLDSAKDDFNKSYEKFLKTIDKELKNFEIRSVSPDAGSHNNTKSYTDMMESIANARMTLAMGNDGPTDEKIQALDNIKNMCNEYIVAKNKQFAPLPSQMRKARLQFAEDLKKYAENASKNLKDSFKEIELSDNQKNYSKLNFVKNTIDLINTPKIDVSKINKESITQDIINLQKKEDILLKANNIVKSEKEAIENQEMLDISLKSQQKSEAEKNLKSLDDDFNVKLKF